MQTTLQDYATLLSAIMRREILSTDRQNVQS
jgi:hypothetical protein